VVVDVDVGFGMVDGEGEVVTFTPVVGTYLGCSISVMVCVGICGAAVAEVVSFFVSKFLTVLSENLEVLDLLIGAAVWLFSVDVHLEGVELFPCSFNE